MAGQTRLVFRRSSFSDVVNNCWKPVQHTVRTVEKVLKKCWKSVEKVLKKCWTILQWCWKSVERSVCEALGVELHSMRIATMIRWLRGTPSIETQENRRNYNIIKTIVGLRGRRKAIIDNSNFATASNWSTGKGQGENRIHCQVGSSRWLRQPQSRSGAGLDHACGRLRTKPSSSSADHWSFRDEIRLGL